MVCTCCPLGCQMDITKSGGEYLVTNNKCPRGKKYALEELTAPQRTITSTVKITDSHNPVIPVKTDQPVPKEKLFTIMKILASVTVKSPVKVGDIIIKNIASTGANIVATRTVDANSAADKV